MTEDLLQRSERVSVFEPQACHCRRELVRMETRQVREPPNGPVERAPRVLGEQHEPPDVRANFGQERGIEWNPSDLR